jgi:hypothetical protein
MRNIVKKFQKPIAIFIIIAIAIYGSFSIHYATIWGAWAFSDSAAYISAARNFSNGFGVVISSPDENYEPLEYHPPFYPFLLSSVASFGIGFIEGARWIDILLFGLLIFSIGVSILYLTQYCLIAITSSLLIAVSPALINSFTGAMSEPLFIFLLYLSLLTFLFFLNKKSGVFLIISAIFTSCASLTRYVGIEIVLAITLLILIYVKRNKWLNLFIFNLTANIPVGLWFLHTLDTSNTAGGRNLQLSENFVEKVKEFLQNIFNAIKSWIPYIHYQNEFISEKTKAVLALSLFCLLIGLALVWRRKIGIAKDTTKPAFLLLECCSLFIIFFLLFLLTTFLMTTPKIDIHERMLSPLWPAFSIVLSTSMFLFYLFVKNKFKVVISLIFTFSLLIITRYYFLTSKVNIENLHREGFGHSARVFRESELINEILNLPEEQPLISNNPGLVLLYTNRMPYLIKNIYGRPFGVKNTYLESILRDEHAALILEFPSLRNIYIDDFEERIDFFTKGLETHFIDDIGGIYFFPNN